MVQTLIQQLDQSQPQPQAKPPCDWIISSYYCLRHIKPTQASLPGVTLAAWHISYCF